MRDILNDRKRSGKILSVQSPPINISGVTQYEIYDTFYAISKLNKYLYIICLKKHLN
jgi:hypothetical protein